MTELLLVAFLMIFISAMCSCTEAALFTVPIMKVRQMVDEEKRKGAKSLLKIQEKMNRPIAMIVIANNIANIGGSFIVAAMADRVFGSIWLTLVSGVLTFLVIIFAEIIPKTIGETYSSRISLLMARPVLWATRIMTPFIWMIEKITNPFTKGSQPTFSTDEKEIRYLAQLGEEEGVIEEDELSMLQGVFQLNDKTARDLMTPRLAMTCIDSQKSIEEQRQELIDSQHSRIVVIGESRDDVRGVVLRSELLVALVEKKGEDMVGQYAYLPLTVDETLKADDLLPLFQQSRQHLAIVRDEFGGVAGVVSLEDVVEELTGEIVDETDTDEDMREVVPSI